MTPYLTLFDKFSISFYGIILTFAVLAGWLLAYKNSKLFKIDPKYIDEALIILIPIAVVGARIYHVIDKWQFYSQNPDQIIAIWQGGIGIFGAILFGATFLIIFCKIKKINFLSGLDLAAPSFILAYAIGRLGNLINLEAFGPPTSLPWKIFIPESNRPASYQNEQFFHPTFFYDLIWSLAVFIIIFPFLKRLARYPGLTFCSYAMLYAIGRLITEFFRIDTWIIGNFKVAYFFSSLLFLASAILFFKIIIKNKIKILGD